MDNPELREVIRDLVVSPEDEKTTELLRLNPGATLLPDMGGGIYAPSFDPEKFAVAVKSVLETRRSRPDLLLKL